MFLPGFIFFFPPSSVAGGVAKAALVQTVSWHNVLVLLLPLSMCALVLSVENVLLSANNKLCTNSFLIAFSKIHPPSFLLTLLPSKKSCHNNAPIALLWQDSSNAIIYSSSLALLVLSLPSVTARLCSSPCSKLAACISGYVTCSFFLLMFLVVSFFTRSMPAADGTGVASTPKPPSLLLGQ